MVLLNTYTKLSIEEFDLSFNESKSKCSIENYKKTNDWLLSFGEEITSTIIYNYFTMKLK